MGDRTTSRPETTWGAIRAVIQAGTGVAFWLEDMRSIALFLFAVALATAVHETVAWWRARSRSSRPGAAAADRPTGSGPVASVRRGGPDRTTSAHHGGPARATSARRGGGPLRAAAVRGGGTVRGAGRPGGRAWGRRRAAG